MSGRISKEAYLLALLHAMKHFDCHVGGFLIGSIIGDKVSISSVLPILHRFPSGPIFEIAGDKVKSLYPNNTIVGYYFGSQSLKDDSLPYYIDQIKNTIQSNTGSCVIAKIDPTKLESGQALKVLFANKSHGDLTIEDSGSVSATFDRVVTSSSFYALVDVEDYLNSKIDNLPDLTNREIVASLSQ